jgi:hypothetical protein
VLVCAAAAHKLPADLPAQHAIVVQLLLLTLKLAVATAQELAVLPLCMHSSEAAAVQSSSNIYCASLRCCCQQAVCCSTCLVTLAQIAAVEDAVTGNRNGPEAWSTGVGAAFLEPFGLNADKATVTANGTAGPVHAALEQLPGIAKYAYQGHHDKWMTGNTPRWVPS